MEIFEPIVNGANRLAHFNVRCPSCNKLFRIDAREIASSEPEFQCSSCQSLFFFQYPPVDVNKVETTLKAEAKLEDLQQLSEQAQQSNPQQAAAQDPHLKSCPKCSVLNPLNKIECVKCGVLFERFEMVQAESASTGEAAEEASVRAFPSLMRAWQELMDDYQNIKKHLAFVDRAEDLQAIPFALKKYQMLKEAQPHDPVAQEMWKRVMMKPGKGSTAKIASPAKFKSPVLQYLRQVNWLRVTKLAPLVTGMALVTYGFFNIGARNLVGIGASMIFLTIGMVIFTKGRIQPSDFWK